MPCTVRLPFHASVGDEVLSFEDDLPCPSCLSLSSKNIPLFTYKVLLLLEFWIERPNSRCRAALSFTPPYPAFTPGDFPVVQKAAQKALHLAQKAYFIEPTSETVQRDAAFAQAAVLRWPDGSAHGEARDNAEKEYSRALQVYGKLENTSSSALVLVLQILAYLLVLDCLRASHTMLQSGTEA